MLDRSGAGGLALALALLPGPAAAHSPVPGIEGFYIGLSHPFSSPGQVLTLLSLGLLFGQRWPERFALAWAVFAAGCVLGAALGQAGVTPASAEDQLLAAALAAGVVAALWPSGPAQLSIALAGIAGVLIGLVSTPDDGPFRAAAITLLGSFVGANLVLLYAAGGVGWLQERVRAAWMRIGLRVAAAWIAAIAALLLALAVASTR